MSFTRSDLKDLDKIWKDASSGNSGDGEVPEGKYQAKVTEVELAKSSGGRPQCKFVFKIVGGEEQFIGKELTTYDGLETAQNMGFFVRKIKRFKIKPPTSFEEVPKVVERCLGAVVEIQVKYKDDFLNVYVNKLVSPGKEEEEEGEEEEETTAVASKAKMKAKAKAKEEEGEEEEEGGEEEEGEEEEEKKKEEESSRNFPTLDEVEEMKIIGLTKLLKQFGIKKVDPKKPKTARAVSKALVSIMEDDEYDASEKHLGIAAKWLGLEPAEGKKKLLRQIIKQLGG
jgi:hypothetical protein